LLKTLAGMAVMMGPMAPSAEITLMPNRGNGITLLQNSHGQIGNNILNTAIVTVPISATTSFVTGLIPSFGGYEVQQSNMMTTLTHNLLYDFSDPGSYTKYQGRSYTLLVCDEMGLHKDLKPLQLLRSNLRAVEGIPLREICTANPGGPQHGYIHHNFIARQLPWHPFLGIDGQQWVVCPSVLTDNPHLDHDDYVKRLKAACGNDEDLLRAWLNGDWNINRGAFFAGSIDETKQMLRETWPYPVTKEWRSYIAMDWGSSAPSVVYFCLKAPGDIGGFPRNSLILVDEIATHQPNDLTAGLNWPPSKLIEYIKENVGKD